MSQFQEVAIQDMLTLINNNSAFKGDIADWLTGEMAIPGARVFLAKLPPVNMHRKVGPIRSKTRLNFYSSAPDAAPLRFMDSRRPPANCKLEELGDEAIILVVDPIAATANGVSLRVEAS